MQAPTCSGNRRLGGRPALRLVSCGLLLGLATVAVAVLPASESGAVPTTGQTFYVNSATDTGNDTGCTSPTNTTCGIDDAITAFNADTTVDHADTIVFTSTIATFTVGHPTQIANTTSGVTLAIDGNGPTTTAVSGGNTNQVFNIGGGTAVTMSGLTIENGDATGSVATGGGFDNSGTLGLTDSVVNDNAASGTAVSVGGGIFNAGALTVSDSTISNNSTAEGGGIYSNGTATITDSTLSDNHATYSDGGGIVNAAGTLTISNSTISGNTANGPDGQGGGISNFVSTMTISNSTISGNTSPTGQGGGISNEGEIIFGTGTITVGATIIANSGSGGNCVNEGPTAVTDLGYNLEDDAGASCGFSTADHDIVGENPDLGPLQNNDGPTDTLGLLAGSPAIDLVDSATLCAPPDQRGITRPTPVCDSGAYETSTLFTSGTPGFTSPIADAVPSSVCLVTIAASGGQGGDASDGTLGGGGASVTATVPVTPGAALDVEVGGAGTSDTSGVGGIGGGGGGQAGGGGGGASAVSSSGTPLVVAGAGGGASDSGGLGYGDSPGGAAGTLGNAGASGIATDGTGGSGGSSSGNGGAGGDGFGGGGGGVANNGGGASSSGGPGGGGNGSVGGGGGGSEPGTGGGVGGAANQTGAAGPGTPNGGPGDDDGGNGGSSYLGGGGGGGVGFGGGGGGSALDGGGGAGYGGGGGGQGPSAGGGGGSSYVTASVVGTPTSSNTSTGDGQVTISYNPADKCPTTSTTMVEVTPSGNTAVVGNGASLTDFLTVTGRNGGPAPSNTAGGVDFYVCHLSTSTTLAPGVCPATGTPEDAHEILAPVGDKGDAESTFFPTGAGTWCFSTTYSGDSNYAGSSDNTTVVDANECALVSPASPRIITTPSATSVTLGATPPTLTDTAALSDGYMPTGTITFTLYNPAGTLVATKTVTVSGNGSYTTPTGYTLASTGTDTGTYQWDASYASGNANNTNTSENNAVAEQVKVVSPCGSLTAYFLAATSGTGNFTGIFCVNTAGTGTYTQYSPGPTVTQTASGSGTVKISGTTTAIAASGTKLALLGEKTTASNTFTETAPTPMKTGTFTLTTLP